MKNFIRLNFLKLFFATIFFIGCCPSFCQAKDKPKPLSKEQIREKVLQISTGTIKDFGDLNSDLPQTDFAELIKELESLYTQFPDHKFVRYIARKLCQARRCNEESIEIIKNAIEKLEEIFDEDLEVSIDPVAKAAILFCRKLKRTFCYFSLEDFMFNEGGRFTWFVKKNLWIVGALGAVTVSFLAGYYLGTKKSLIEANIFDYSKYDCSGFSARHIEAQPLSEESKALLKDSAESFKRNKQIICRQLKCSGQGPTNLCPFFSQWHAWKLKNIDRILITETEDGIGKIEEQLSNGAAEIKADIQKAKSKLAQKFKETNNERLKQKLAFIGQKIDKDAFLTFEETFILYALCPEIEWLNPSNGVFRLGGRLDTVAFGLNSGHDVFSQIEPFAILDEDFPEVFSKVKIDAKNLIDFKEQKDGIVVAHQPSKEFMHFLCFRADSFLTEDGVETIVILVVDSLNPDPKLNNKIDDEVTYLATVSGLLEQQIPLHAHFPFCLTQHLPFFDQDLHEHMPQESKDQNKPGWLRQDISGILQKKEQEFCRIFENISEEQFEMLFKNINVVAQQIFVRKVIDLQDKNLALKIFNRIPQEYRKDFVAPKPSEKKK